MDLDIQLPTPGIQTYNNYSAKLSHSSLLPSAGFTCKYDPDGDYIAIGCNNGEKILFSTAESSHPVIQIRY